MNTKEIAAKLNWAMQAVPLAKEQKDVLVNIILQLAEQSSQEIPTYEAATEEKLGLVKQAATVAEISGDTIEGYASYNPCHIQSTTPAPAA